MKYLKMSDIHCTPLVLLFLVFSPTLALQIINCSLPYLSFDFGNGQRVSIKDPIVYFLYNRDNLGVYEYAGTSAVNILLNETGISIRGKLDYYDPGFNINNEKLFTTEVIGNGNIANTSNISKGLINCKFFVLDKQSKSFHNKLPNKLDAKVFEIVEECLTVRLCQQLGAVRHEDVTRARMTPRNFNIMTIGSREIQTSYPKIIPQKFPESVKICTEDKLIQAANTIIAAVARKLQSVNRGTVRIPDTQFQVFHAHRGSFSGLGGLQRDDRVQVQLSRTNKEQSISFTFGIPKGYVRYEHFETFRHLPFVGQLCADVQDLLFMAVVRMDFRQNHCVANLQNFDTVSPGSSRSYTCGQLSFFTNPLMQWFVNAWNTDIVRSIQNHISLAMATYVYDNFNCELYRQ